MIHPIVIQGKLRYVVGTILGQNAASSYLNNQSKLSKNDIEYIQNNGKEGFRYFNSKEEAEAYLCGLDDGMGHDDYCIPTLKDFELLYGKIADK